MIEAAPVTPDFASLHPGYTFAKWVCAKNKAGSTTCLSSLFALRSPLSRLTGPWRGKLGRSGPLTPTLSPMARGR